MLFSDAVRFNLILDNVRRIIDLVDRLRCLVRPGPPLLPDCGRAVMIRKENVWLEGWIAQPEPPATAAVLLFHGMGDHLFYWRHAQHLLAGCGFASLVFHYSGYGRSPGPTTPANLAADALAAYEHLRSCLPGDTPVFLLGFSLGSGIASEVAGRLYPKPAGLILCEAFPTLRLAAERMVRGLPLLPRLLPDMWHTRTRVAELRLPLLIVHSRGDQLFPASMAEDIFATAVRGGSDAELRVFDDYRHNAPYLTVPVDYWAEIVRFMRLHMRREEAQPTA
jgi:alpha-beta hydrolase superfamily lysophospholipase